MIYAFVIYFIILLVISRLVGKGGNDAFFRGNRQSPWPLVAFGMVGASISGLTFIGVPGWVSSIDMTYMQMCFGFILGYVVVAFVLLPLYYKYGLTSIYTYLQKRFGNVAYRTGASFFVLSKLLGSAAKFYVVVQILQMCVADAYGVPYAATALITLLLIWLYTRRSGIRAIVWTDVMQTLCLLLALVLILLKVCSMLNLGFGEAMVAVWNDPHSRMFEFDDVASKQYFWKQFLSGVFVVIVMTGLDQDMMQKNLTCKDLKSAQKDMCAYGLLFAPVNFLFLALGILLLMLYAQLGMPVPAKGDELLSSMVFSGTLGQGAMILFALGVVASAFSSADSSLVALTTSYCIDIAPMFKSSKNSENKSEQTTAMSDNAQVPTANRRIVHIVMMIAFYLCTLAFNALGSGSVMDLIYTLVSYTYGPLLGLFAFGMMTKRIPREKGVPFVAVLSPVICYVVDYVVLHTTGYKFGYEMLMLNGLLTFSGLYLLSLRGKCQAPKAC